MNKKSILIIIATLLLGFVLGMLTSARIRYQKLKPVTFFFSEERFREGIYHAIDPDDEQKEKLENVIRKYARSNRDMQIAFRKQFEDLTRNLWNEMEPILTQEQKEKLQEMEQRRQEYSKRSRGRWSGDQQRSGSQVDSSRMRQPDDSSRFHHYPDSGRDRYTRPAQDRK